MRPIFHLAVPVRDLEEAVDFYRTVLGARIGRRTPAFADALVFGAQVTLQQDPSAVVHPMPRTRHFGATVTWEEWEVAAARWGADDRIVEAPTVSYEGQAIEQAKLMIADPSGNLIELKAYRRPEQVLGELAVGP